MATLITTQFACHTASRCQIPRTGKYQWLELIHQSGHCLQRLITQRKWNHNTITIVIVSEASKVAAFTAVTSTVLVSIIAKPIAFYPLPPRASTSPLGPLPPHPHPLPLHPSPPHMPPPCLYQTLHCEVAALAIMFSKSVNIDSISLHLYLYPPRPSPQRR